MPLELTKEGKCLLEALRDNCKDLAKEYSINIELTTEPFYDQHKTGFQELSHLFNFLQANNKGLLVEEFDIANNIIQSSNTISKKLKNVFLQKINKDNFKGLLAAWKIDKEVPYNHLQIRAIIHVINKLLDPKFLDGCANQSSTPEKRLLSQHFKLIDNDTKVPIPYLAGDFKLVQKLFQSVKNLPDSKTKLVKYTGNFVIAAVLDKKLPELINNLFNIIAGKQQLLVIYENCANSTDESNTYISVQNQLKILIKKLRDLSANDKKFDVEYANLANEVIQLLDFYLKKVLWQNLKLNNNALHALEDKTGLSTTDIKSSLIIINEILSEEAALANRSGQNGNAINRIKLHLNNKYINTIDRLNIAKNNLVNGTNKYEGHKDKRVLLQAFKLQINETPLPNKANATENTIKEENISFLQKCILNVLASAQSYFIQMNEISKNIKELPGKGGSLIIAFLAEIMEAIKIFTAEIHVNAPITNTNSTNLTAQSDVKMTKEENINQNNKFSFFKLNNKGKNKIKEKTNKKQFNPTKPKQIIELLKAIKQIASHEASLNTEAIIENFSAISLARKYIKNISLNEVSIDKYLKKINKLLSKENALNYTILDKENFTELQLALDKIVTRQEDKYINTLLAPIKNNSEISSRSCLANIEALIQKLPEESFDGSLHFTKAFCRNFNCISNKNLYIHAKTYEDLKQKLIEIKNEAKIRANANILQKFFYFIEDIVKAHTEEENNNIAKVKIQLKQL